MRAALCWQCAITVASATVAAIWGGKHAALSAALGGGVILAANAAYALTVSLSAPHSVGATIQTMVRAQAIKVTLVVLGLWLAFSAYREVEPLPLFITLMLAVLVWPVALLYRD